jgi:hypothetical protein
MANIEQWSNFLIQLLGENQHTTEDFLSKEISEMAFSIKSFRTQKYKQRKNKTSIHSMNWDEINNLRTEII